MAHPQSSPFGLFAKQRIDVGSQQLTSGATGVVLNNGIKISNKANAVVTGDSTGVVLNAGIKISDKANAVVTGDSTGIVVVGGVKISNARVITADSTGFVLTSESALPGNVDGGDSFTLVSNSTGVAMAVNSTGTTWKYLNTTSLQPT